MARYTSAINSRSKIFVITFADIVAVGRIVISTSTGWMAKNLEDTTCVGVLDVKNVRNVANISAGDKPIERNNALQICGSINSLVT